MEEMDLALESEFNNAGELLGVEASGGDVLGQLEALEPVKRFKVIKKLLGGTRPSRGSRGEMEKFFKQLPSHIKRELLRGAIRLADYTIYSIKRATSKTIKIFEPQDDKEIGLRNISNNKLPKNSVFLVSGVFLLAGISADASDIDKLKATKFEDIFNMPTLANGEFSLKSNRKLIIPENFANQKFVTEGNEFVPMGYFKLDNPRLINDEELIEATIELGTMEGIDPNAVVKVVLDGTVTTP